MRQHTTRLLVVMEAAGATPALLAALERRAAQGPIHVRLVVPNPARAELHLLHPERHDKAAQAEAVLHQALPAFEAAAGGRVVGSVSVRHDPMDTVEEVLFNEPIDEIVVAVAAHGVARWLHQDLVHRLAHFQLPVTAVEE